jgi:glycosyltransferase involved in cell wall biosynthesis
MIKNLHIITRLDMGGSAQNTLLTCLGLNKDKYEVVLVHGLSLESQMTDLENNSVTKQIEEAQGNSLKVVAIPSLVRKIDPVKDLKTFFSLWRLMLHEKPTIVHTHTSKAGILGRLAAKLTGVPFIVHTTHGHVFYGHFGPLTTKFFLVIERAFASFTQRMIALTDGEKNDYLKFEICEKDKIVTIHSGVDIERFLKAKVKNEEKKKILGVNPNHPVVGTVGWLLPIKGPKLLLNAMKRIWQDHTDVELVFVGKGELEASLKADALNMGVSDKVKFLGWRDDVHEIMPIFDVFVLPSLNEGMGRVLVEAMAAGKPVVASCTGGIPDLVRHRANGLLVTPGSEQELATAIRELLKDPEQAKVMGQEGKNLCWQYSIESMVEKIDSLYMNLLNPK